MEKRTLNIDDDDDDDDDMMTCTHSCHEIAD